MLRELRIRNFTIIDDLSIHFDSGLNVLTGETGAGKSIIVDAIGLVLGDKASADMIKAGSKEAGIEAYFDNSNHPSLKELSIESDEGITVRRNVSSQGKGRAYINDTSISLQTLAGIGESLINIHGQHEHQGLLKKESHLILLDGFAGLTGEAASLKAVYDEVLELRNNVNRLKERIRERSQRIEFLRFQINEIDAANLKPGEKEAIEEEMKILLNLNKLKESSETAYSLIYESQGSCIEQMSQALSRIRDMAGFDAGAKELLDIMETTIPQIEDAALLLRKFKDKYDIDPQRLTELDERLDLIKRLEKKYGEGVDAILKYRGTSEEELNGLVTAEERQESLQAGLDAKENEIKAMSDRLSDKRIAAAKKMEKAILGELHDLGFQKADFKVDIKKRIDISAHGMDDVEFLFSANPGEPPRPLIKVASGGELSRIMLALKCMETSHQPAVESSKLRTLIFDEVDAGIGGVTAQHVGKRLKEIAGNYQVLCITHLPQIAALADNHLKVEKIMGSDAVKVNVEPLTGGKRHDEIARMLSGKITDSSLKHARELLGARI
ncbi:MAG: DNA repair protein RecN [Nitrospirae bacterium GWC2_46_6]|nr:MAG: DNA repair protein RecN [Nitrospirae bacterium GWC2_46_6]OGW24555.1 MAG: DNA repair protein RecN [Nitrospirae bacterium GWB2_47_37]HAK89225.1 DNA repair protein RecN [Nitrospiraceae bacterium]HCL81047.1 DNA repair protein RecN [Nitrospiraceae bacterium]